MKMFKKALCALLSAALLCSLWGCKKTVGGYTYDSAADFRAEEGEVFAAVPTGEFGGFSFNILSAKTGLSSSKIDSDCITGAVLSDAVYKRNRNAEARLNIKITERREEPQTVYDLACKSVLADEDLFSAVWNTSAYMGSMAANGYLASSEYLTEINTDKPWWNKSTIEASSVDGLSFLLYGDIQLSFFDAHSITGVNMSALGKLTGADNPYELVKSGAWTLENLLRLAAMAENDTDGNGIMTSDDMFGAAVDASSVLPLLEGCGVRLSDKDEYGLPYLTCVNNERFYDVYMLICRSLYSGSSFVYKSEDNPADGKSPLDMFREKKSLFCFTTVGELEKLRNMDSEFGVLPMPKLDESQRDYVSYLSADALCALGVPASVRNFLRCGIILENLAAESHRPGGVRELYTDSVLAFRYISDRESRENLNLVFDSSALDLCDIFGWGGLGDKVTEYCVSGNESITAALAASQRAAREDIGNTIDSINRYR